jgi:flotillin
MFTAVCSGEWLLALASAAPKRGIEATADPDFLLGVVAGAIGLVVAFIVTIGLIKKFLYICGPHEILVFSGRKFQLPDGTTSNYKIIHGGRGLRTPFLEVVSRMDMRLFPVEVTCQNAYSAGGIPLTVRAIANVKLSSDEVGVRNAVERFLDTHPSQIATAAQQTLEGVLREVISQLTPEQVNEDRLKFAETLMDNARDDFHKLGLDLDVLKVQHVSDDQEYLVNLGRARIAEMLRDAENAEALADQAVAEAKAAARQSAEMATKQAETKVVMAKNEIAGETAKLEATARQAENQGSMAVETARSRAEQQLQKLRAELEKLRLHNDVVLPAEAKRKAEELKARGEAAPAVENGKAAAEALGLVATEWANAGPSGRDVYVLQQLPQLASVAAQRVANSEIGNLRLVAGDERSYAAVLASYPAAVARVLRETAEAVGIDIDRLLAHREDESGSPPTAPKRPTLPAGATRPPGASTTQVGRAPSQPPPPLADPRHTRATVPGMPAVKASEEDPQ